MKAILARPVRHERDLGLRDSSVADDLRHAWRGHANERSPTVNPVAERVYTPFGLVRSARRQHASGRDGLGPEVLNLHTERDTAQPLEGEGGEGGKRWGQHH